MSELKLKNNIYVKRMLIPITFIFPFLFSMGVCSETGILRATVATLVLSLFISEFDAKKLMPSLFNFLIISFVFSSFGFISAIVSLSVSGIIVCFGYKISNRIYNSRNSPVISGIMLGTAITITVMQTTNYFGIGATGNTVREMIMSYISLGFHGNWRGVLYGTIVLVIMITFPRKFKITSKTVSPMFISLLLTLILNYFLNPSDMISAINEAGEFTYNYSTNVSVIGIISSLILGVFIGLSNIFSLSAEECSKQDYILTGLLNLLLSPLICFIPKKPDKSIIRNIPGTVMLAVFIFIFKDFLIRIPVHSCAVILIVSAWENVKWRNVKHSFTNGILPLIIFLAPIALIFLA